MVRPNGSVKQIWYLSPMRAAKVQVSLREDTNSLDVAQIISCQSYHSSKVAALKGDLTKFCERSYSSSPNCTLNGHYTTPPPQKLVLGGYTVFSMAVIL